MKEKCEAPRRRTPTVDRFMLVTAFSKMLEKLIESVEVGIRNERITTNKIVKYHTAGALFSEKPNLINSLVSGSVFMVNGIRPLIWQRRTNGLSCFKADILLICSVQNGSNG